MDERRTSHHGSTPDWADGEDQQDQALSLPGLGTVAPVRAWLPEAAKRALCPPQLWNAPIAFGTTRATEVLLNVIVCEENAAQSQPGRDLLATARALRSDLLRLRDTIDDELVLWQLRLLGLSVALSPIRVAVSTREDGPAYDWLRWSLTTTWDVDGEDIFHFKWVLDAAMVPIPHAVEDVVVPWLIGLYQYDARTGGHPQIANELLGLACQLGTTALENGDADLAAAVLSWLGRGGPRTGAARAQHVARVDRLVTEVRKCADASEPSNARRLAIRLLAAVPEHVSGEANRSSRARQFLKEYRADLHPVEEIEVLGCALGSDSESVLSELDRLI